MSNYPLGAATDRRAPYNEVPVKRTYKQVYFRADTDPFCPCGTFTWFSVYVEDSMTSAQAEQVCDEWCNHRNYVLMDFTEVFPCDKVEEQEEYFDEEN